MAILTTRTALAETPASGDLLHIVDVSDTTDNAAGTSKKITRANLVGGLASSGANSDITSLTGLTTPLTVAQGGTGAATLTGIVKGNGTSAFTVITAPTGDLVGTSDTQTLTNKTVTTPTLTLKQGASVTPTAEGDIQWDTDDNQIKVGDGASTVTFSNDTVNSTLYAPIAKGVTNGDSHDHSGGDGAQIDHGSTGGLLDDDHTQYSLVSGTRAFTGKVSYSSHPTFSADTEIVDKKYVDDAIVAAGGYTDEQAQDAVGGMLTDTSTIDFTYTDAAGTVTADVKDASITLAKMANLAQNTIIGRVTASTGVPEALTATNVRTIINVEDGADVTDATNVDAAGAVMNSDTSTASMSFVIDEDNMSSNSATKVPTQQSVKAYADTKPTISSGAGAPSSTPTKVGDIYIDTTGDDAYIAVGTASSSDWEKSNDGAGGGISDGDKGDITVSASGATWTIDSDVVTYAKMQNVSATNRILGRSTAGSGDVEEITVGGDLTQSGSTFTVTSASDTTAGKVELATIAETNTGTDATRAVTPDGLAGSDYGKRVVGIQVFDSATDVAIGDGKAFFRIPSTLNGYNLVGVAMNVYTAGTTGTMDVQIRNVTDSVDMLSTKLTIDSTETDTSTAATAAVIDTTKDDVATGDKLAIDVDAVQTTKAKGLYVELIFQLP